MQVVNFTINAAYTPSKAAGAPSLTPNAASATPGPNPSATARPGSQELKAETDR